MILCMSHVCAPHTVTHTNTHTPLQVHSCGGRQGAHAETHKVRVRATCTARCSSLMMTSPWRRSWRLYCIMHACYTHHHVILHPVPSCLWHEEQEANSEEQDSPVNSRYTLLGKVTDERQWVPMGCNREWNVCYLHAEYTFFLVRSSRIVHLFSGSGRLRVRECSIGSSAQ